MHNVKWVILTGIILCMNVFSGCNPDSEETLERLYFEHSGRPSLKFPIVATTHKNENSEIVNSLIKNAEKTEDISFSLALFNYYLAMGALHENYYRDPSLYYCNLSFHTPEPGSGIPESIYQKIPILKLKAFKTAEKDFIECLILRVIYSEKYPYQRQELLCDIADLIDKQGNTSKAQEFRKRIVKDNSMKSCCLISKDEDPHPETAKFLEEKFSFKNIQDFDSLKDILEEIRNEPPEKRPESLYDEIMDSCLKSKSEEYVRDFLLILNQSTPGSNTTLSFNVGVQRAGKNRYYQALNELSTLIKDNQKKSVVTGVLLQEISNDPSLKNYKPIIDQQYDAIMAGEEDKSNRHKNRQALLGLAVAYFKLGDKQKSNEIIDSFFSHLAYKQETLEKYTDSGSKVKIKFPSDDDPGLLYQQLSVPVLDMAQTLVKIEQKDRAILMTRESEKYTQEPEFSKEAYCDFTSSLIAGYFYLGLKDDALRVFDTYKKKNIEINRDLIEQISNLLKVAIECNRAGENEFVDDTLKSVKSMIRELPENLKHATYSFRYKLNALAEYDTSYEIANLITDNRATNDEPCLGMVKSLIENGNYETAAQKSRYINIEQWRNQTLLEIAEHFIDQDQFDKALEITEIMTGDYSGWSDFLTRKKIAIKNAKDGNLNRALTLINLNQKDKPKIDVYEEDSTIEILIAYADSNKITEDEQAEIIDHMLPIILKRDYFAALRIDHGSVPHEDSAIKLIYKAQDNLIDFADYMAQVNIYLRPTNAESKLSIARTLIDFGQREDAIRELNEALDICEKFSSDSQSTYMPVKVYIAGEFYRIGNKPKAMEILNAVEQSKLYDGLREKEIIDLAKIFKDVDSNSRAERFMDQTKNEVADFHSVSPIEAGNYLKALWLLEDGKYQEALEYRDKVELLKNQIESNVFDVALNCSNYDYCFDWLNEQKDLQARITCIEKLIDRIKDSDDSALIQRILKTIESIIPNIQNHYHKVEMFLICSKAYEKLGKDTESKNYLDKAMNESDASLANMKDSYEPSRIIDLLRSMGMDSKADEMNSKLPALDPRYRKNPALEKMFNLANKGRFQDAINCLGEVECLDDPTSTMLNLAKIMIDQKQFDYAMDTIEWTAEHRFSFECPSLGDRFLVGSPFDSFPGLFLENNRFDLALKAVKYVWQDKLIPTLMAIEKKRREINYTLTSEDKKSLRRMIFQDAFYINRMDEELRKMNPSD
jgi:hypothetical protein